MGKLLTCLPRLTLAQLRTFGQLQVVRAAETMQNSHRPQWKFHVCLLAVGRRCQCHIKRRHHDYVFLNLRE